MKKINIKGTIVSSDDAWIYEWLEIEHTSPKSVDAEIAKINDGDDVVVEINSSGGSVFSGSEIYTKLKKMNVDVEVVGVAASAASVIAMAGKTVKISPMGQIMIHNASTIAWGDKDEMDVTSALLNSVDSGAANAYQLKTGIDTKELLEMMSKETWLNAQQAVEKGFADEVMFEKKVDAVANAGVMLPENVINKVKNMMIKPNDNRLEKIEQQLEEITNKLKGKSAEPVNKGSFNMLKKWR